MQAKQEELDRIRKEHKEECRGEFFEVQFPFEIDIQNQGCC